MYFFIEWSYFKENVSLGSDKEEERKINVTLTKQRGLEVNQVNSISAENFFHSIY
jgi:hypothetical protein